jgi:hypothetical protein
MNLRSSEALHQALAASRSGAAAATLSLESGDYFLEHPLLLKAGVHDGLCLRAADPAKPPRLHALKTLEGWSEIEWQGQKVWRCPLPEALRPRRLFVDGAVRSRARWPKFDPCTAREQVLRARPYEEGSVPALHWGTHRLPTEPGDINPDWLHLDEAEAVIMHFWVAERLPDLRFDAESGDLISSKRSVYRLTEGTKPLPVRYYLDNLPDALSEPGEWCLIEKRRELLYLPHPGETLSETRIAVPVSPTLIRIEGESYGYSKEAGDPMRSRRLRGLRFENILFFGNDWLPSTGKNLRVDHEVPHTGHPLAASVQGEIDAGAAIELSDCEDCRFDGCRFERTGAHALRIGAGCENITVANCHFTELGGGAILAHGADIDGPPSGRTRDLYILNNHCEGMGLVFHGACGVLGGAVRHMVIAHNCIRDLFYSGISLGWTWGYADTVNAEHLVEYNRIEQVSQGLLNDLGGIYFVGRNTGTIVRKNIVRDVKAANFGGRGIYLDEGCLHFLIEQNIVDTVGESCVNMHYGRGHLIRHNLLCRSEAGISLSRDDGGGTFTAMQNIFWQTEFPYWGGYAMPNLAETTVQADSNCFHPQTRDSFELHHPPYLDHPRVPFADWEAAGNDCNCLFADPALIDPANGDYRLSPDSPMHRNGFRQWDHQLAGPIDPSHLPDYGSGKQSHRSEF